MALKSYPILPLVEVELRRGTSLQKNKIKKSERCREVMKGQVNIESYRHILKHLLTENITIHKDEGVEKSLKETAQRQDGRSSLYNVQDE